MSKKKKPEVEIFSINTDSELSLPFAEQGVKAGFPSPAQDYLDASIDLNKELIKHPASTFFAKVSGNSMVDACINDGDILIVDKSLSAKTGDIVVCYIDGEFTLKYLQKEKDAVFLLPGNDDYPPIRLTPDNDVMIWGKVTYSISHQEKPHKKR